MVRTGYRQLIVMRHAKTEQVASSDRVRQLTARGQRDARAAGRWLRDHDLVPDVVLTSPAVRARQTTEQLGSTLGMDPQVVEVADLYGASPGEVVEIVGEHGGTATTVLVVGHNPTMEDLAHSLQRDPEGSWAPHLPTAGIAVLRVSGDWTELAEGTADLTDWQVPRD